MTLAAIREPPTPDAPAGIAASVARARPGAPARPAGAALALGERRSAQSIAASTVAHAVAPAALAARPATRFDAATILRLYAMLHSKPGFDAPATAFATDLARMLGAERVSVGFVDADYCEVAVTSGVADFRARADVFRAIGAAMDEAIEQGVSIVHPGATGERPRVTLAHAELARRGSGSVCTVPLVVHGLAVGAITLERSGAEGFARAEVSACENLACMLAPTLELRRNADLLWRQRLSRAWKALRQLASRPGHVAVKLASLVALAVLAALCIWPVQYRVSAPARLEGAIQRALVAPADGFLQHVNVKPGDLVKAGQVLAELADQDLAIESRKWASELAQHENSARAALARAERTQYVVFQGKASEARAQLDLVEQQLTRGRIRAPFEGVVIKGDLSQMLGAPVQRGDVLLTVAPAQQFRLIVEVDERDIADVRKGAAGAVALAALAGETLPFQVVRVTPVATSREGRNFYEVEAAIAGASASASAGPSASASAGTLASASAGTSASASAGTSASASADASAGASAGAAASLRPGLLGVAKIRAPDRSLAWIWGHRLLDWLRLSLWSLGG